MPIKRGSESPNWKGDSVTDKRFRARAREVYQEFHNVNLPPDIDVHHIDGDHTNNSIENLKAMPHGEHSRLHHREKGHKISLRKG